MLITWRSSSSVDLRAYRKYFGLIFILFLDTKQTNPPSLIFAQPASSPLRGDGFCGARPPPRRAEQPFQIVKFLLAVKLYPLREPFSRDDDPPRRPPPLTLRRQPSRKISSAN